MKHILRVMFVAVLFTGLGLLNMGGCGSSGGGGNVNPTDPPPTMAPPTNPPPTNPPPTEPPPPEVCEIPDLDTDFSDTGYFFFDPVTGLTTGVTSDGDIVVMVIVDSFGDFVGAGADVIGPFVCLIFVGIVGDAVLDAEGLCAKSDDSTLWLILDFSILGVPIVDESVGECFAVEPLGTSVASVEEELESASRSLVLDMQTRGELDTENPDYIYLEDSLGELEN